MFFDEAIRYSIDQAISTAQANPTTIPEVTVVMYLREGLGLEKGIGDTPLGENLPARLEGLVAKASGIRKTREARIIESICETFPEASGVLSTAAFSLPNVPSRIQFQIGFRTVEDAQKIIQKLKTLDSMESIKAIGMSPVVPATQVWQPRDDTAAIFKQVVRVVTWDSKAPMMPLASLPTGIVLLDIRESEKTAIVLCEASQLDQATQWATEAGLSLCVPGGIPNQRAPASRQYDLSRFLELFESRRIHLDVASLKQDLSPSALAAIANAPLVIAINESTAKDLVLLSTYSAYLRLQAAGLPVSIQQ